MKTLRGLKAKEYIEKVEYGLVHKDFLEQLFILEDFVDGSEQNVPVAEYYDFIFDSRTGDAFLDDIYGCVEDLELGHSEMVTFGIENTTIKVGNLGELYIIK